MENGSSSSTDHRRQRKACSYSSVPKIARKVIEKNRRIQMKTLFSKLSSLLPPHYISRGRDGQQLPEQVDEAANYIKNLQVKFEKLKEKKDKLLRNKGSHEAAMVNENPSIAAKKPSLIEINEMGPDLDIILITGLDNHSMFHDTLRFFLDEQVGEVVHANFSVPGPSYFHIVRKKISACEISKRLKELVDHGFSSNQELVDGLAYNEDYSDLQLWDFEIQSNDIWDFAIPVGLPTENIGRCYM